MRRLKHGFILFCAALMAFGVLTQPVGATTQTFRATVRYANAAIVKKTLNIGAASGAAVAFLFFDSYGDSWVQGSAVRNQAGAITVAASRDQFMNFLTDPKASTGLEAMKVMCLTQNQCSQLLAPATGKDKTVYIGMNLLIKNHGQDKAGHGAFLADASPSVDITVVYQ